MHSQKSPEIFFLKPKVQMLINLCPCHRSTHNLRVSKVAESLIIC